MDALLVTLNNAPIGVAVDSPMEVPMDTPVDTPLGPIRFRMNPEWD